jgi:hypothetical protein
LTIQRTTTTNCANPGFRIKHIGDPALNEQWILWVIIVIFAGFTLCSCVANRVHSAVPAFAQAVNLTTTNTHAAFQLVEQKYEEAEALALVVDYDLAGFNPENVKPWLTAEDVDARTKLLKALQQYAAQLESVSGSEQLQKMDEASKEFGKSLTDLSKSKPLESIALKGSIAPSAAATAVDAIGRWLMDNKRNKELPSLIEQMQDPVQKTCMLLTEDIGSRTSSGTGKGLRDELWLKFSDLLKSQDAYIQHNKDKFSPAEKLNEVQKLPTLVRQRQQADQMLAQTSASLQQLVQANADLLKAVRSKQDLRANIDALYEEAERINDFYHSLNNSSK